MEKARNEDSIVYATYPAFNPAYLKEDSFTYPVSINGKTRTNIEMALTFPKQMWSNW